MDTVEKAYTGEDTAPEKFTYFEYALSEEQNKESEEYKASEKFYAEMLQKFETVSEVPADKNGKPEDGSIGLTHVIMDKSRVEAFCKDNAITPATLFLAASF